MSTSIYEHLPKERPSASSPSSRLRKAYRREVYGDSKSSHVHKPHRKHSKKKISLMGFVLVCLFFAAGILVITVVVTSMNAVGSTFGNSELQYKESPLVPRKSWSR